MQDTQASTPIAKADIITATVQAVSLGSRLEIRFDCGEEKHLDLKLEGHVIPLRIACSNHKAVYTPHKTLDVFLSLPDFLSVQYGSACVPDLFGFHARLHPNGIIKLFFLCRNDASEPHTQARRSQLGQQMVRLAAQQDRLLLALHDLFCEQGVMRETGPLPLDTLHLGRTEEARALFRENVEWRCWVSTHVMATAEKADLIDWRPDSATSELIEGVCQTAGGTDVSQPAFQAYRYPSNDGRHAWRFSPDLPSKDELIDILDGATIDLELRTILEIADSNTTSLAQRMELFLAEKRENDLASVYGYLVSIRARLSETTRRITSMQPAYRTAFRLGAAYHDFERLKESLRKDFDTVQLAVQAFKQKESDRFSRIVTFIGLVFTAISFVATITALVDYLDHDRQSLSNESRLVLMIAALCVGVLGVTLTWIVSSRRKLRKTL